MGALVARQQQDEQVRTGAIHGSEINGNTEAADRHHVRRPQQPRPRTVGVQ
jgi:hypothetical protein